MANGPDQVTQMVQDPDFGKLSVTQQRQALSAHDASFGSLADSDISKFVSAHQSAASQSAASAQPQGPTISARTSESLPPVPGAQTAHDIAQKLEDWSNLTQEGRAQHPVQAAVGD